MTKITIDNKEYDADHISEKARIQLTHLQAVELELQRLHFQVAIHQAAKTIYVNDLKKELESGAV